MADNKKNQKIIDSYDYLANAASTQDCTGLIPAAPTSKAELESYEDIYHYEPPKVKVKTPDSEQPPKKSLFSANGTHSDFSHIFIEESDLIIRRIL